MIFEIIMTAFIGCLIFGFIKAWNKKVYGVLILLCFVFLLIDFSLGNNAYDLTVVQVSNWWWLLLIPVCFIGDWSGRNLYEDYFGK